MPQNVTETTPAAASAELADTRTIRIFQDDLEVLNRLHEQVNGEFHVTVYDLIRESIRAGLPAVQEKYAAALKSVQRKK